MAVTALPAAPQRTDDSDTFNGKADNFVAALPQFASDLNTLQQDVASKWTDALAAATQTGKDVLSTAANVTAAVSGSAAAKWVSGTTYAQGVCVWSPSNFKTYRKATAASVSTIDPANDSTNWALPVATVVGQSGDVLFTRRALTAPDFLKADGSTYLKSAYPALAATIGSVPNDLGNWTAKTNIMAPAGMNAIAVVNGLLVTCGTNGTVMSSPDGAVWTYRSIPASSVLNGVAYGNGLYVVVGNVGVIYTSPDLVTWTAKSSGVSTDLNSVAFGGGKFVAVGTTGTILYSLDGTTWTGATSAAGSANIWSVVYASGLFVAGSGGVQTSADGVTWASKLALATGFRTVLAYGNGIFMAAYSSAASSVQQIYTSSDGATWNLTSQTPLGASAALNITAVVWTGTVWLVYGNGYYVAYSANTTSWTTFTGTSLPNTINPPTASVLFNGAIYVAVNTASQVPIYKTVNLTGTSTYAATASYGMAKAPSTVRWVNNQYVAVSPSATTMVSSDGYQWTCKGTTTITITDVAFGNGAYVLTDSTGKVYSSTDLITLTVVPSAAFTSGNTYVTFANGVFVAAGNDGTVKTSADGTAWATRYTYSTTVAQVASITGQKKPVYGNGQWLVAGATPLILVGSANAVSWTAKLIKSNTTTFVAQDARYGSGVFVVIGNNTQANTVVTGTSIILTSSDLVEWVETPSPFGAGSGYSPISAIDFNSGMFLGVSADGSAVVHSVDGYSWRTNTVTSNAPAGTTSAVVVGPNAAFIGSDITVTQSSKVMQCGLFNYDTTQSFCAPVIKPVDGATAYYKT